MSWRKFIKNSGLEEYLKSPKGRFFCLLLAGALLFGIFTISPFNKDKQVVFAKPYVNFINIEPGAQATGSLVIGQNSVVNAIPSPVYVSSANLGLLLDASASTSDSNGVINYTVQKGETISEIADKFNISVETILLTNELSNSHIEPGQELMILPTNGIIHMVDKGETVKSIAKTYKADEAEIIKYNNLSDNGTIYEGDVLIVPGGKMPVKQAAKPTIKDVADGDTSNSTQLSLPNSYFIVPTSGLLTQGAHFSYVANGKSFYNSVDIANDIGTPVRAAAGGEVQIVKNAWPYGKYITIAHPNGVVTLYAHLSNFAKDIVPGMAVTQGQIIGYMGNTGNVKTINGTGSHLHFETRGTPNPLAKYRVGTKVSY